MDAGGVLRFFQPPKFLTGIAMAAAVIRRAVVEPMVKDEDACAAAQPHIEAHALRAACAAQRFLRMQSVAVHHETAMP